MSIEQYLIEINSELADAESLNPAHVIPKIQILTNSGCENIIIQTIRTCIHHYSRDRAILKYAHVLDKLLKMSVFNQIVQNVIVQFFCDIFIFLLIQKCYNQLDELKILRKFWLKKIHPRHLQAMKDLISVQAGVDIDQYFKQDVILTIRNHYEKTLKLTPQQMAFHLPKTIKSSNAIYDNKMTKPQPKKVYTQNSNYLVTQKPSQQKVYTQNSNYLVTQKPQYFPIVNVNPTYSIRTYSPEPLAPIQNPPVFRNSYNVPRRNVEYYPQNQIFNEPFHMKVNFRQNIKASINPRISPPADPRDPRLMKQRRITVLQQQTTPQQQNIKIQKIQVYSQKLQNQILKRQRLYSEQTRSPNGSQYLSNQPTIPVSNHIYGHIPYQMQAQPQKRVHYNQNYEVFRKQPFRMVAEKWPQRTKHSKMLQMLRGDRVYKCKQCGKGFKNMCEYDKHLNSHFDQRLSAREKRKMGVRLVDIDVWTEKRPSSSLQQFNQFYITVSNLSSCNLDQQKLSKTCFYNLDSQPLQLKQIKCKLCDESFDLKFFADQWILNNATFCLLGDVKMPLHKTCQEALDDSSSSDGL